MYVFRLMVQLQISLILMTRHLIEVPHLKLDEATYTITYLHIYSFFFNNIYIYIKHEKLDMYTHLITAHMHTIKLKTVTHGV